MDVTVTGRHVEITPPIREYCEAKMAKLPRYYSRVAAVDVVVDKPDQLNFEVEVKVTADRQEPVIARESGTDLYGCLDSVVDKLERQLTDRKERVRHHKGKQPMSG